MSTNAILKALVEHDMECAALTLELAHKRAERAGLLDVAERVGNVIGVLNNVRLRAEHTGLPSADHTPDIMDEVEREAEGQ